MSEIDTRLEVLLNVLFERHSLSSVEGGQQLSHLFKEIKRIAKKGAKRSQFRRKKRERLAGLLLQKAVSMKSNQVGTFVPLRDAEKGLIRPVIDSLEVLIKG